MGEISRTVTKVTLPVVTEQFFIVIMGSVNAIMVSNIGKEAISGISLIDSISLVVIALFSLITVGSTIIVAQYAGTGDRAMMSGTARQAVMTAAALSVFVSAALFAVRRPMLTALYSAADQGVLDAALAYFTIALFSYPLLAVNSTAFGVMRGSGDTKTPMRISVIMNGANIALSYVLIYGLNCYLGPIAIDIPGFGVHGAAIGLTAARLLGASLSLYAIWGQGSAVSIRGILRERPSAPIQREIMRYGIPACVESTMFQSGKIVVQMLIVRLGTAAITANFIANSIFGLINIPGEALCISAVTLVGQSVARGDGGHTKKVSAYVTLLSSAALLVLSLAFLPFLKGIIGLYTQDAETASLTYGLLLTLTATLGILWSGSFVLPPCLRSVGDVRFTMYVSVACMWLCRVVFSYLLTVVWDLGIYGIWVAMYMDWVFRTSIQAFRLARGKWVREFERISKSLAGR